MGRIRTIKPEFPQSESLGRVSREARLCFILLWTIVDDAGRTRASSRMLASLLYPYDDDAGRKIEAWLAELEGEKCIRRYSVDGSQYLDIPKWLDHQKIDRPSQSKIPPFDEASRIIAEQSRTLDDGPVSVPVPVKDQEGAGALKNDFDEWWEVYPRKVAKPEALKAFAKARKKTDQATLLAATKRYLEECRGKEPAYIKHPGPWLNAERWLDEPAKVNGNGYAAPGGTRDGELKAQAKAIASTGRPMMSVSDHRAREMVQLGLLTEEQARKAGYAA